MITFKSKALDTWGQEITINSQDIKSFGISNTKTHTQKGTFKKFVKTGFIRTTDNSYKVTTDIIKELKTILKGKYETEKFTMEEYKNGTERKAVDWTYRVQQEA